MSKFVSIRRDLHQIPELGFQEFKTQAYLLEYLQTLPQERLEIETWRTGIFVFVKGTDPKQTIGYRTDMDGLPIAELTGHDFASQHEGKMHACGHDVHMSIALGVLTEVVMKPIRDNMLFLFQPAEEGPGGAKDMVATATFLKWKPDFIIAFHIAPEYPVGTFATKPGLLFANTSEVFVDFKGLGGHAAFPHLANDMVVACGQFVSQIQSVVSRNVNPLDSAVITFGKMFAGTANNIIAENARLEGTIRTLSPESMQMVKNRLEEMANGFALSYHCEVKLSYGSAYYQVENDEMLTNEFMEFVQENKDLTVILSDKLMAGEDFGFMIKEVPGFLCLVGVGSPFGLHHAKLNPNEDAIEKTIQLATKYLQRKSV